MRQSTFFPLLAFCHLADCILLNDSCFVWQQHPYYSCPNLEVHQRRHVMAKERGPTSALFSTDFSPSGEDILDSEPTSAQNSSKEQPDDPSMFFELMSPNIMAQPDQMSASSLAYLGDVVYELFVRSRYVWPSRRMSDMQNTVVSVVRAEAQSLLLQKFMKSFALTSTEQAVVARGRNANLTARKKGKSKSSGDASAYQDSTAFEALLGYTYISDKHRFNEMIGWIKVELDELDSK